MERRRGPSAGQNRRGSSAGQDRRGSSTGQDRRGSSAGQNRRGSSAGQERRGSSAGQERRGSSAGQSGKSGAQEASYKVYIVTYIGAPNMDDHRALFVATAGTPEAPEGPIFHVIGPAIDPRTRRAVMTYETKVRTPFQSASYNGHTLIGKIAASKLPDLKRIAEGIPAPSRTMRQKRPNCVTWVSNLLFKLNEAKIIDFEESFNVPKVEQSLTG